MRTEKIPGDSVVPFSTRGSNTKPVSIGAGSTVTAEWPDNALRVAVIVTTPVSRTSATPVVGSIETRPGLLDAHCADTAVSAPAALTLSALYVTVSPTLGDEGER